MIGTLKRGLLTGLQLTWTFGKIIFPITLIVSVLQYTPVLPWLIDLISPFMNLLGLSGDAAIPLVIGNFLNLYAAIGAILSLDLTVKEVFIIAVMLSFSHNMLIESGVALKVGVKLWIVLVTRIGLAVSSAVLINLLWQGRLGACAIWFYLCSRKSCTGRLDGYRFAWFAAGRYGSPSAGDDCHPAYDCNSNFKGKRLG